MKFFYFILLVESITANIITDQRNEIAYRLPAEWEPHERTLMAWPRIDADGDDEQLSNAREDIAYLANIISEYEPVVIFADPAQVATVEEEVEENVEVVALNVDGYWTRNTSPVFLHKLENGNLSISGVIFNFNGYGNKQFHENDAQFAKNILEIYQLESLTAKIVSEGGAFQTDGKGTLFAPKSSLVNENRNNQTIIEIENELKKILGIKKVIWFSSIKGEDLTDGHLDSLVRYVRPGVVLLSRPLPGAPPHWFKASDQAYSVLKSSTDAEGNQFEIIEVFEPDLQMESTEHPNSATYLKFYICNGLVVVPEYGDRRSDLEAQKIIQAQFPDRKLLPLSLDSITLLGGGIHAATYQFPAASNTGNRVASLWLPNIFLLLVTLLSTLKVCNNFSIF